MSAKSDFLKIDDQAGAQNLFRGLLASQASLYDRGTFFKAALLKGIWESRSAMALSLGVHKSQISRAIGIVDLPNEVVQCFGNPDRVTRSVAGALATSIKSFGAETITERAIKAQRLGYSEINDLLEFVRTGRVASHESGRVVVRLTRDRKAFRVEIPHLARYESRLPRLEFVIASAFSAFERAIQREEARDLMNEEIFSRECKAKRESSARVAPCRRLKVKQLQSEELLPNQLKENGFIKN